MHYDLPAPLRVSVRPSSVCALMQEAQDVPQPSLRYGLRHRRAGTQFLSKSLIITFETALTLKILFCTKVQNIFFVRKIIIQADVNIDKSRQVRVPKGQFEMSSGEANLGS